MNAAMRQIVREANESGSTFFDPGAMTLFNSRVTGVGPFRFNDRANTRLFITSEYMDDPETVAYTLRMAVTMGEDTNIYTLGDFMQWATEAEALDFVGSIMDAYVDGLLTMGQIHANEVL